MDKKLKALHIKGKLGILATYVLNKSDHDS